MSNSPFGSSPFGQGNSQSQGGQTFGGTATSFGSGQVSFGQGQPGMPPPVAAKMPKAQTAPNVFLFVAIALAIVGVVLSYVIASSVVTHILAWLVATLAFVAVAAFLVIDVKRRASRYSEGSIDRILFVATIVLSMLAIVVVSVNLGLFMGRA